MADMMEYKCPSCGGAMEFDSASQKMKCPYCGNEMPMSAFEEMQQGAGTGQDTGMGWESGSGQEEGSWEPMENNEWQEGETAGMRVYSCQSCGGEIVADETTGATDCPFCGNHVVMKGQFAGDKKPDCIIPFKLDKKAAKKAYQSHIKGKPFLPAVFGKENHIDEIKGVYVPFWMFDAQAGGSVIYDAEQCRVWEVGDTEYTETKYFELQRSGSVCFENIPTDCSKKMDDELMQSIEPFNMKEAVPFKPAYMAGYMADRYDETAEESIARAKGRICSSTEMAFESTASGYTSVHPRQRSIQIQNARYRYALLPVWILNTQWKGKKYVFAMNGQTGKMVGNLPFDKSAFTKFIAIRGTIIGAVIYALMWAFTLM